MRVETRVDLLDLFADTLEKPLYAARSLVKLRGLVVPLVAGDLHHPVLGHRSGLSVPITGRRGLRPDTPVRGFLMHVSGHVARIGTGTGVVERTDVTGRYAGHHRPCRVDVRFGGRRARRSPDDALGDLVGHGVCKLLPA